MKEAIKDFGGWILGWIETKSNGDRIATDFSGVILGRYDKARDVTTNFEGWILGHGDFLASLIRDHAVSKGDGRF